MILDFKTKTEAARYIRALIAKYPDDVPLSQNDRWFALRLLSLHPNAATKIGLGDIKHIVIKTNKGNYRKPTRCFYLIKPSSEKPVDFSWTECLKNNKNHKLKEFKKACRNSVDSHINRFKIDSLKAGIAVCALTGKPLSWQTAHVHHYGKYSFDKIVDTFISERKINIEDVELDGYQDGCLKKTFVDKQMADDFSLFHNTLATLKLVDYEHHLRMKRRIA